MTSKRSDTTGISWTHFPDGYLGVESWTGMTWNPTVGCTRVSPGCDHCYAFTLHDQRYADNLRVAREVIQEGEHVDLSGETAIREPLGQILAVRRVEPKRLPWPPQYDMPFSTVQMLPDRVDQPLHWRKPRAVFVDSMADVFHEDVTDDYLDRVFAAMALASQHVFMILTKRPERARAYLGGLLSRFPSIIAEFYVEEPSRAGAQPLTGDLARKISVWPLPNVWLGVSVEDQERAHERIPVLLDTPAAIRFVSAEPLLAPLDFTPYMPGFDAVARMGDAPGPAITHHWKPRPGLDWILVGGESGARHRDMPVMWAADIQRQCHEAGIAYFGKQRSDFRSGLALPHPLNEKQWPAATWGGVQRDIWRS